jgi:ABC-type oligopeptide transport system substrate-binding subunit
MRTKGRLILALSLSALLVAGCGPSKKKTELTGKVTYKNAPVTGGTITFYSDEGNFSTGITPEGTYTIAQLPNAQLTVTIETESINPSKKQPTYGGAGRKDRQMSSPSPEDAPKFEGKYVKIPKKYADKAKSGLSVNLSGGQETKDFDLTD